MYACKFQKTKFVLTTIMTLLWNNHFEMKTQKISYKNAQLSRTAPT